MRWATCAAACAAAALTATVLSAQAPAPSANRAVAIGCVSQQQAGGRNQIILTDTRSTPPAVFILEGDPAQIDWHVGHTLEVVGSLSAAPGGAANTATMKVTSVVYISNRCEKR